MTVQSTSKKYFKEIWKKYKSWEILEKSIFLLKYSVFDKM